MQPKHHSQQSHDREDRTKSSSGVIVGVRTHVQSSFRLARTLLSRFDVYASEYTLVTVPGRRHDVPQLIYQRRYNGPVDLRRYRAVLFKTVQNAVKRFAMLFCARIKR